MDDEQIRAVSVGQVRTYQDIVLVEYNPRWPMLFEQAAEQIRAALGPAALQIHHVGSTSVVERSREGVRRALGEDVHRARRD